MCVRECVCAYVRACVCVCVCVCVRARQRAGGWHGHRREGSVPRVWVCGQEGRPPASSTAMMDSHIKTHSLERSLLPLVTEVSARRPTLTYWRLQSRTAHLPRPWPVMH
ncbi:hypothetical protein E2C01_049368 [Portunus trituberculatus]|uniref:Uncharacterized protein n=1 Tax=Portunus trituberculatus TaxID=210409 RepID=A0A5B7GDS6_PORTR|nr:hypothetical protein [Portunus trituberculatus]